MTDTEILSALQALIEEHFDGMGLRLDFCLPGIQFVIKPGTDLRGELAQRLQPHLVRLVTRKLTKK